MLSIKKVFAHSIKHIFSICFLVITFSVLSVFGQTQKTQEPQQLPASQTIERELAGDQTHKYRITLKANEFLQVKAEQKGVDVVIRLFDSKQKQLAEMDSPNGTEGFEELLFITENSGEYEIQISVLDGKVAIGKYILQWSGRIATENDQTRINAKTLYDAGWKLITKSESRNEGVAKLEESRRLYQKAGDIKGEIDSLDLLGSYSQTVNDVRREYYNQELALIRKLGDKTREADVLTSIGLTYGIGSFDPQKKLDYLNQALLIYRAINDKRGEANTLKSKAGVYRNLNNYQKAIEYYNQALSIHRTENTNFDKEEIPSVLLNISYVYGQLGDKQKALDYANQALSISQAENTNFHKELIFLVLSNISLLYSQLGDKQKALEYSNQAKLVANANNKQNLPPFLALSQIAVQYENSGDYQKAIEYLEQAVSLSQGHGNFGDYLYRSFVRVYLKLGEKEKAFEYLNKSLLTARNKKNQNLEESVLIVFGDTYKKFGEFQKALEFYNQSLQVNRASNNTDNEGNILRNISDVWLSLGNSQLAIVYSKQAVNNIQRFRFKIKGLDKDTKKAIDKRYEPIYRKLADILISEGRFPEAQAVLDLLKEEEFNQIVRRSGEPLFTLPYSKSEEDAIKIVDRLAALGRELSDLKAKPKDALTAEEITRLNYLEQTEIPAANKALRLSTEAFAKAAPDVKDALELKMKDNIQTILPALGKGVVALYTVVGKTSGDENAENKIAGNNKINVGWILLVTPEFRKAYPIDTKDLEQTVFKFRESLRSSQYDPQPLAAELYKKLFLQTSEKQKTTLAADLETYLDKQKDKTLMWSLDGVLRYVPMAALHDGKGYLVEKYRNVVFNTASLGSLKDATKPNWEVVGLGVSTEGTVKSSDGKMLRFSALKGSESELNSIIKEKNRAGDDGIFSGTLKINKDFTKEALFEGARTGMPVMHISSHFYFNTAQEETSFLLLGNGGRLEMTEFQDYPNLFSNVDFLSLSACDTATGGNAVNSSAGAEKADIEQKAREANGKEIEGFAYRAQTLGAKSVMASLWQVSDIGTKELMLKFYQIRKEQPDMPKGEALRQAQLSLLQGTNKAQDAESVEKGIDLVKEEKKAVAGLKPFKRDEKMPFAHPYYWSSFILIGNWR